MEERKAAASRRLPLSGGIRLRCSCDGHARPSLQHPKLFLGLSIHLSGFILYNRVDETIPILHSSHQRSACRSEVVIVAA